MAPFRGWKQLFIYYDLKTEGNLCLKLGPWSDWGNLLCKHAARLQPVLIPPGCTWRPGSRASADPVDRGNGREMSVRLSSPSTCPSPRRVITPPSCPFFAPPWGLFFHPAVHSHVDKTARRILQLEAHRPSTNHLTFCSFSPFICIIFVIIHMQLCKEG